MLRAITIIRPETLVRWHRAGFRHYWRWKSRLGDRILGAIVMHRQSGDDDHALTCFDPQAAARIDDHGIRRRRQGQR